MSIIPAVPPWLVETAKVSDRIGKQKAEPPQKKERAEVPGREVEAQVTVSAPVAGGAHRGQIVTETFQVKAADPPVEIESEVAS